MQRIFGCKFHFSVAILLSAGKKLYQLCCVQYLLMEFIVVDHRVNYYYRRIRSVGQVIFSLAFVILSTRGVCPESVHSPIQSSQPAGGPVFFQMQTMNTISIIVNNFLTLFVRIPGNRWALERAKYNLVNSYLLVGLTEELGDFVAVLEATLPRFFAGATELYNSGKEILVEIFRFSGIQSPQCGDTLS